MKNNIRTIFAIFISIAFADSSFALDPSVFLRVRAKINSHSGASAGRADARRRDAGNVVHCRGAVTQQMHARRHAPEGGRLTNCNILYRHPVICLAQTSAAKCEVIFARTLRVLGVDINGIKGATGDFAKVKIVLGEAKQIDKGDAAEYEGRVEYISYDRSQSIAFKIGE